MKFFNLTAHVPFLKHFDNHVKNQERKWKWPSIMFIFWAFGMLLMTMVYLTDFFELRQYVKMNTMKFAKSSTEKIQINDDLKGYLIKTPGCKIPEMDPFHISVRDFISKPKEIKCNNGVPPLFGSNLTSIFIIPTALNHYNLTNFTCCYHTFKREDTNEGENDKQVSYNNDCLSFEGKSVNIEEEFIKLICKNDNEKIYEDYFAFIPTKQKERSTSSTKRKPNVLILGLDTVSRINFHRQMPLSMGYLTQQLGAFELLGYNKVADNTFLNLMPVLSGFFEHELQNSCWPSAKAHFDNCSFVWQNFSNLGYTTAFAEDCAWMGIFNFHKKGFSKQPVDYYYSSYNWIAESTIGNNKDINCNLCLGGRKEYVALLDYAKKFLLRMKMTSQPYFGFFWESSLTHDYLNYPALGDPVYYDFLKELKENGYLENTILIVMSDHGIRWGRIRKTYQGQLEERLPFVYLVLPEWIKKEYPIPITNLRKNTRKLTTPFDLHVTLKSFLDINSLSDVRKPKALARGYSLFSEIPLNRTCEEASITSHWCTCQQSMEMLVNNTQVQEAANFSVSYINNQLRGYGQCAVLKLDKIISARLQYHEEKEIQNSDSLKDFTVVLMTIPGEGVFESGQAE